MNHKILFVDLDATLLSEDKTVSEENRAAIQKMLLAGHDIVLSTGRPVESGRVGQDCCKESWTDQSGMLYDRL